MTEPTARVVVTLSDRVAAAIAYDPDYPELASKLADDDQMVQLFAHHRLQGERDGVRKAAEVALAHARSERPVGRMEVYSAIRRLIDEESA